MVVFVEPLKTQLTRVRVAFSISIRSASEDQLGVSVNTPSKIIHITDWGKQNFGDAHSYSSLKTTKLRGGGCLSMINLADMLPLDKARELICKC